MAVRHGSVRRPDIQCRNLSEIHGGQRADLHCRILASRILGLKRESVLRGLVACLAFWIFEFCSR